MLRGLQIFALDFYLHFTLHIFSELGDLTDVSQFKIDLCRQHIPLFTPLHHSNSLRFIFSGANLLQYVKNRNKVIFFSSTLKLYNLFYMQHQLKIAANWGWEMLSSFF